MHSAIIDTSVYINSWERSTHQGTLQTVGKAFLVRHSSVVLSELRRGALDRAAQKMVDALLKLARVQWIPTAADWWEAGRLIRTIGDAKHWDARRRRDFQNDALIGLTARRHGAAVVTADVEDFDLLARHLRFYLIAA